MQKEHYIPVNSICNEFIQVIIFYIYIIFSYQNIFYVAKEIKNFSIYINKNSITSR